MLVVVFIGQQLSFLLAKRKWAKLPVVAAKIIESKMIDYTDMRGTRHYRASIKYEYEFRGRTYIGETPALEPVSVMPSWGLPRDMVRRYKQGDIVNARVLPNAPKIAYLELVSQSTKQFIVTTILVVLGILLVTWYIGLLGNTAKEAIDLFEDGGAIHTIGM